MKIQGGQLTFTFAKPCHRPPSTEPIAHIEWHSVLDVAHSVSDNGITLALRSDRRMNTTRHFNEERSGQRGITHEMARLAICYGKKLQDKYVLNKRQAEKLIVEFKRVTAHWSIVHQRDPQTLNAIQRQILTETQREIQVLQEIGAKGGVVVVSVAGVIITAYRCE